jgi:hypothetical protein
VSGLDTGTFTASGTSDYILQTEGAFAATAGTVTIQIFDIFNGGAATLVHSRLYSASTTPQNWNLQIAQRLAPGTHRILVAAFNNSAASLSVGAATGVSRGLLTVTTLNR